MLALAPEAMSPKLQLSVLLTIEQGLPAGCEAMLQETPEPVGSGSFSETLVAVPGPLLLTVITKPIWLPASTGSASATLVMLKLGQRTVTVSDAVTVPSFVSEADAVFGYALQLAAVVGLVM